MAMKEMESVDTILSQRSVPDCPHRSRLDRWLEISLIPIYWINYGLQTGYHNVEDIFFSLSATYFALVSSEFLIFGKYMLSHFKSITRSVVRCSEEKKKELSVKISVHNRLCNIQKDLNAIYSLRFSFLTFTLLLYSISRLHATYIKKDFGTMNFFFRVNAFLFYWIIFLRVVDCTAAITSKVTYLLITKITLLQKLDLKKYIYFFSFNPRPTGVPQEVFQVQSSTPSTRPIYLSTLSLSSPSPSTPIHYLPIV